MQASVATASRKSNSVKQKIGRRKLTENTHMSHTAQVENAATTLQDRWYPR